MVPVDCSMHQNITYYKPSGTKKEHYSKNVDHARGEDTIPSAEQDRLPHKQLHLPPWLSIHLRVLHKIHTKPCSLENKAKVHFYIYNFVPFLSIFHHEM